MVLKKTGTELLEILPGDGGEEDIEACHESSDDEKYSSIAERAYYKAEARRFEPGREIEDWLDAENEINQS